MSYKFDSLIKILNKLDGRQNVTVQSLTDGKIIIRDSDRFSIVP